ncbi:MAG: sporulation protein YqfD [Lachnospiraceae bacterium]|nr:sporulation protein YqfD [Lachnospiraceae bacterium]
MKSFMNRKNRWKGRLTVRVSGENPERFFNLCSFHGILLEAVEKKRDGIYFFMKAEEFFHAGRLARKARVKLRITEKQGLPFFLRRSRKRIAFYAGILCCLGLLYASSLFIWDIHVEGNTKYTDSTLLKFLEEKGYVHGMAKSGILCEDIEKEIRNYYEDITWVSAEISGNRLIIRIKENPLIDLKGISDMEAGGHDVTATKSGTVISIITRAGTPLVHSGDVVEPGQTLISGNLEIFDESGTLLKTEEVQADGDVFAATVYHYQEEFPLAEQKKYYTGEKKERNYLWIFGHRLFLPGGKNHYQQSDEVDSYEILHLWENFYLPLGWGRVTAREYQDAVKVLTKEEAETEAERRFQAYCTALLDSGAKITDSSFHVTVGIDSCKVTGTVYAEESIGISGES